MMRLDVTETVRFLCNDLNNVGNFIRRILKDRKRNGKNFYNKPCHIRSTISDDVNYIASILRGDFDKAVSINVLIKYAEDKTVELTKEQYRCDQLEDNPRCLIKDRGPGKHLLHES